MRIQTRRCPQQRERKLRELRCQHCLFRKQTKHQEWEQHWIDHCFMKTLLFKDLQWHKKHNACTEALCSHKCCAAIEMAMPTWQLNSVIIMQFTSPWFHAVAVGDQRGHNVVKMLNCMAETSDNHHCLHHLLHHCRCSRDCSSCCCICVQKNADTNKFQTNKGAENARAG